MLIIYLEKQNSKPAKASLTAGFVIVYFAFDLTSLTVHIL